MSNPIKYPETLGIRRLGFRLFGLRASLKREAPRLFSPAVTRSLNVGYPRCKSFRMYGRGLSHEAQWPRGDCNAECPPVFDAGHSH